MMTRFIALFFALTACATATNDAETPRPATVHFQGPAAAAQLPHRTAQGAEAAAVFDALRSALPPQETYDVDALSCVFVSFPGHESTHCQVGAVSIDQDKARSLGEAVRNAGAQWEMGGKMPSVRVKKVHSARDALAFDDEANAKRVRAPNARLTGKEAEDVMAAIAGAGVREDDGSLLVVCHRFEAGKEPTCGYILRGAAGPQLDRAQTLALWNAFVHDPKITVLNAFDFVFDGQALSFTGVQDTVQPPPSPPSFP